MKQYIMVEPMHLIIRERKREKRGLGVWLGEGVFG
jgi:hypothetical protein